MHGPLDVKKMTACCWWNRETDKCCWISVEIHIWILQSKSLNNHSSINLFGGLHQWGEKTRYEGWNFNSGNYLFTTDTK